MDILPDLVSRTLLEPMFESFIRRFWEEIFDSSPYLLIVLISVLKISLAVLVEEYPLSLLYLNFILFFCILVDCYTFLIWNFNEEADFYITSCFEEWVYESPIYYLIWLAEAGLLNFYIWSIIDFWLFWFVRDFSFLSYSFNCKLFWLKAYNIWLWQDNYLFQSFHLVFFFKLN